MRGDSTRVGRYELRERLGGGGFATVYRAFDPVLDREVALKVLHPHLARDAKVRERFVQEGRALARVRHANVVQIFDAGEADGTAYLAMELVEGAALSVILAERGRLPLATVVAIVDQAAEALAALHARNLIHRDVKPANIIVERGSSRAVLLDLGLARSLDSLGLTAPGWLVGTPSSLAPEQLESDGQVTPQTDVYQLGTTAYTLLAGRPPFEGDEQRVLRAIVRAAPPDLGELRPDLPPGVVAVVAEAMAKNPARRPAGTREFAAQLRAAAQVGPAAPTVSMPVAREPGAGTDAVRHRAADARTQALILTPSPATPTQALTPPPSPAAPTQALTPTPTPAPAAPTQALTPPPAADLTQPHTPAPAPSGPPPAVPSPAPPASGPSAPRPPSRARTVAIILAVAIPLIALGMFALTRVLPGDDTDATRAPLAAATAAPPPTPPPALVVSDLKVHDNVTDRREQEFVVGSSFVACFTLAPGGNNQPLVIVAADRSDAPPDANDPSVVARSNPVPQRAASECYPVNVLKPPLPRGAYWVSVLHGSNRLASASFVARARPGEVLLQDDFKDPDKGRLPRESDQPSRYRRGYDGGEYVIRKLDPQWSGLLAAELPGSYDNATIAVEVRLVGESRGRFIALGCRAGDAGHYRLTVGPANGAFVLSRWDGAKETPLVPAQLSPAIRRGNETNRLELACAGDTISATINGTPVASAQDGAYREGGMWIGAEETPSPPVAEARFVNLTVVQR